MQTDIIKIGPSQNASPKLCPATDSLTGVKCRATSVAKNWGQRRKGKVTILNTPGRIFCQPSPDFKYFVSHCAIHKLKSGDSTKCSAILLGEKSVWKIWSKILNQNIIHKTSFKVSTSRVPFPTNGREKLGQRRRTKSQSRLLAAEYFDSTKCFAKYFVSHCAIHKLKSRDSTKCSAILLGAKSVWEIWSKILNQNLIHKTSFKVSTSRVPFPTDRREKLRQRRRTKLQSQLLPAEYFVSHCAIHHLAESPNFKNLFQIWTLLLPAKVLVRICFSEILFKFSDFNFSFSFQISKRMFTTPGRIFCQPLWHPQLQLPTMYTVWPSMYILYHVNVL